MYRLYQGASKMLIDACAFVDTRIGDYGLEQVYTPWIDEEAV